jgi:antitoxin CcdA
MNLVYNTNAPKRATNLSINSDLLKRAKQHNINLSKSFEIYLNQLVREHEAKKWQEENRQAISEFNQRVEQRGLFGDGLRSF